MLDWQYVDRLTGIYEEAGVPINREPYGPLTGTLVPPCISHSVAIIEALAKAYISTTLANAIVFAVLIVVLLVKPAGLLGKYVPEKV